MIDRDAGSESPVEEADAPPPTTTPGQTGRTECGRQTLRSERRFSSVGSARPASASGRQPGSQRHVNFSSSHVIEIECSPQELERRQQWNEASKALRRKNKARMREEKQRERCMQEQQRGREFGVSAMPEFLAPRLPAADGTTRKREKSRKNPLNLQVDTTMAWDDESSDSDEIQKLHGHRWSSTASNELPIRPQYLQHWK